MLPRFDCCACTLYSVYCVWLAIPWLLSCAYIVCMVCWKYVLGVECASVCTLYIVSCMSKWWRWWVVLWCWLACRWRQLGVGVSQSALRKSAYQCPVNWANQWLTRSARFVLYKRKFGSSIQSAIVIDRVSIKYCQYCTVASVAGFLDPSSLTK